MSAHAEIADIVEKDHTGCAGFTGGFAQQRANHSIMPARLSNDCGSELIKIAPEAAHSLFHRSNAEIRKTGNNDASGFSGCVGIDGLDPLIDGHREMTGNESITP